MLSWTSMQRLGLAGRVPCRLIKDEAGTEVRPTQSRVLLTDMTLTGELPVLAHCRSPVTQCFGDHLCGPPLSETKETLQLCTAAWTTFGWDIAVSSGSYGNPMEIMFDEGADYTAYRQLLSMGKHESCLHCAIAFRPCQCDSMSLCAGYQFLSGELSVHGLAHLLSGLHIIPFFWK